LKGKRPAARPSVPIRLDFVSTNEAEYSSFADSTVPAFIPADYISQPQLRIQAYKKLAEIDSKEALKKLAQEWEDRFGAVPDAVQNLITLNRIKLVSIDKKVTSVEVKEQKVMLVRGGDYLLIGDRFPRLTSPNPENKLSNLLSLLERLS
jgi:transcription-repair coupling factor (superfamily II helicase)